MTHNVNVQRDSSSSSSKMREFQIHLLQPEQGKNRPASVLANELYAGQLFHHCNLEDFLFHESSHAPAQTLSMHNDKGSRIESYVHAIIWQRNLMLHLRVADTDSLACSTFVFLLKSRTRDCAASGEGDCCSSLLVLTFCDCKLCIYCE